LWLKIGNLFGDGLSNYVQVIMVPNIPRYPLVTQKMAKNTKNAFLALF
jgi:hypothetical protein